MASLIEKDRVAIITGASSGIGLATALEMAKHGMRLALAARRPAELEDAAAKVRAQGGQAIAVPTDVMQQDQIAALVKRTLDEWGQVDVLVANAGVYVRSPLKDLQLKDLEFSMAVNFYGSVYPVMEVLPHMLQRRSGHIVFVTSGDGKKGLPKDGPYVAAKFALSGFGDVLRQELRGSGVHTSTVYPGRVDTPMIEELEVPWIQPKASAESVARAIVRGIRRRTPEVYTPPIVYMLPFVSFLSPRLADWAIGMLRLEGWKATPKQSGK